VRSRSATSALTSPCQWPALPLHLMRARFSTRSFSAATLREILTTT
jgi:hypothetical protein